jgi:hypothetical protein
MAGSAGSKEGGRMKCQETAELISALCDGETIPREAAEHIGECEACRARLNVYSTIGAELRRVASLEEPKEVKAGSWEKVQRVHPYSWQEWRTTMRIPRFAFALMLGMILLLSGGLVLVRARTGTGGPALTLTYKIPPDGRIARCTITADENPMTNHCNYGTSGRHGLLTVNLRFVGKEGERTELGVKTRYKAQMQDPGIDYRDDLRDVPEEMVWIEPRNEQKISVPGLGEIELSGEYLDHIPTLLFRPDEALDPQKSEFRIASPVLIRGKEVLFNLAGSSSIDSGDQDAALMVYFPAEGRYLISTVPFEGAAKGNVELGQINFSLEGQHYVLLTAMPTTRSEHVWVTHEPHYKLSEHMQGASDRQPMFMVRSLSRLLQDQIHH